jgi:hypothetical protein
MTNIDMIKTAATIITWVIWTTFWFVKYSESDVGDEDNEPVDDVTSDGQW